MTIRTEKDSNDIKTVYINIAPDTDKLKQYLSQHKESEKLYDGLNIT